MFLNRLVKSERMCYPHQVQDGDSLFDVGVDQEGGLYVLD